MSGPSWTLPDPPNGYVEQPASDTASQQAIFFGEDIYFDIAVADANGYADYVISAAGDFTMAMELDALRQSLIRRLVTAPGEWKTLPNYGVGAQLYVKQPNTAANRAALEAAIRSQFMQDDRVQSVTAVQITSFLNGDESGLEITVQVVAQGSSFSNAPLQVQITIA